MFLRETGANWLLLAKTVPHDRTSRSRPRPLLEPAALPSARRQTRGNPEERFQYRKLLLAPNDGPVPTFTRPRIGRQWGSVGHALRVCSARASERLCPPVLNQGYECMEMASAWPEFSAMGARGLEEGLVNRIVFEVRSEPTATRRIAQVGIARVGRRLDVTRRIAPGASFLEQEGAVLDEATPLLASLAVNSAGDVLATGAVGALEVVAPGGQGAGLRHRMADWLAGGPTWLTVETHIAARILLEVDLRRGRLSVSAGEWSEEPAVVEAPDLLARDEEDRPWVPFVSLTAVGQEARILDFAVRADI